LSGILFHKSRDLQAIEQFYTGTIGMRVWLRQAECVILQHGNLLLGFCQRDETDRGGIITFFYDTRHEVDLMHVRLRDRARAEPQRNERYRIYHFFASDPEERTIEFQTFEHPLPPYRDGEGLLLSRRSVRAFTAEPVEETLLTWILDNCAYAPSSRNDQPCTFVCVRERDKLERLAAVRGPSSAPVSRAPMAIAICSDPEKSRRPIEDGCIAAYHFLLAAWAYGLGTCWIGGMDQDGVKETLGIPHAYTIACVTPLGHPAEVPATPPRREVRRLS